MLEDEDGSNRVKEARHREDAYLEQKVREADEAAKTKEAAEKNLVSMPAMPSVPEVAMDPDNHVAAQAEHKTWDEILDENIFHDIVNDDTDMYAEIESLPGDTDNMVAKIIGIVQNHVSEVWSQPRNTKLAEQHGLSAGFALDLQVNDEDGQPWDFDKTRAA